VDLDDENLAPIRLNIVRINIVKASIVTGPRKVKFRDIDIDDSK
jgi:hypothetical protein